MNFDIRTNVAKRMECAQKIPLQSWIFAETNKPLEEYYTNLSRSKFVLCPEGTGPDCHRLYEALYFNVIPIVLTSTLAPFYSELPVYRVDDWSSVTEESLLANYIDLYNCMEEWKVKNPIWCEPRHWIQNEPIVARGC